MLTSIRLCSQVDASGTGTLRSGRGEVGRESAWEDVRGGEAGRGVVWESAGGEFSRRIDMNFRLGVYDLFSRIVPGGVYLVAVGEFARVLGWIKIDLGLLKDIGILPSLVLLLITYLVGSAMERVGAAWRHIFRKRGINARALESFKQKHADRWVIDFKDKDWAILRAYVYIHNPSVAEEADRFNALSIMLKNVSFGLAILIVDVVIEFINTNNYLFLALAGVFLLLSYQLVIRSSTQSDWFYSYIYETILAYRLNLEERVKPTRVSVKGKMPSKRFAGVVARVESLGGRIAERERQVDGLFERLLAESFA